MEDTEPGYSGYDYVTMDDLSEVPGDSLHDLSNPPWPIGDRDRGGGGYTPDITGPRKPSVSKLILRTLPNRS